MTKIIAEIGINTNGDVNVAKDLIDVAIRAGCNYVKFQKRDPDICISEEQKYIPKHTPWGTMTYLEYRKRVEFGQKEYEIINEHCKDRIGWFASVWDQNSVDFMRQFNPPFYKIPSAMLTNLDLIRYLPKETPAILSTGMSTWDEIFKAFEARSHNIIVFHCTSTYPCPVEEINLKMISTLAELPCIVGYSGHEIVDGISVAAVALGAKFIERHITLSKNMWGSDQAASLEENELKKLVKDIRNLNIAMGNGIKRVYTSELDARSKLRLK